MEKQNIIIVGGGDSFSDRNDFLRYLENCELRDLPSNTEYKSWKRWLVEELGEAYYVDIPHMPNKENAKYDEWKIWFERHLSRLKGSVLLIGLSLGTQFLAKYLIENEVENTIPALYLLAGPCGSFDDPDGMDCASFAFDTEQLSNLTEKVPEIHILHSTDDFVVPYEHALKYQAALPTATLHTFEDKNHFLIEEFPELLELIRGLR